MKEAHSKDHAVLARLYSDIEQHAIRASAETSNEFARVRQQINNRFAELARERKRRALERFTIDQERAKRDPQYRREKRIELDSLVRAVGVRVRS